MGKQIKADSRGLLSRKEIELQKQQQKMVDGILAAYDENQSGDLDPAELRPMLADYSRQLYKDESQPSEDDIQFLFGMYDKASDKEGAALGRNEILQVCDFWGEFLKQKAVVAKLLETHDENKDDSLDCEELQALLDEVKSDDIVAVPPEVTKWILEQADVTRNGVLS